MPALLYVLLALRFARRSIQSTNFSAAPRSRPPDNFVMKNPLRRAMTNAAGQRDVSVKTVLFHHGCNHTWTRMYIIADR